MKTKNSSEEERIKLLEAGWEATLRGGLNIHPSVYQDASTTTRLGVQSGGWPRSY